MCGSPRDSNSSSSSSSATASIEINASGGGGGGGSSNDQTNITCTSDKMNDTVSSNNSFNKQQNIYQLGKIYFHLLLLLLLNISN